MKTPCTNCGFPFEKYPPDEKHSIHSVVECNVCRHNDVKWYVKTYYECEVCRHENVLYWHMNSPHTLEQEERAYKEGVR